MNLSEKSFVYVGNFNKAGKITRNSWYSAWRKIKLVSEGKPDDWTPASQNNHLFTGRFNAVLYFNCDVPRINSRPSNWQEFTRFRFSINMHFKFNWQHCEYRRIATDKTESIRDFEHNRWMSIRKTRRSFGWEHIRTEHKHGIMNR